MECRVVERARGTPLGIGRDGRRGVAGYGVMGYVSEGMRSSGDGMRRRGRAVALALPTCRVREPWREHGPGGESKLEAPPCRSKAEVNKTNGCVHRQFVEPGVTSVCRVGAERRPPPGSRGATAAAQRRAAQETATRQVAARGSSKLHGRPPSRMRWTGASQCVTGCAIRNSR